MTTRTSLICDACGRRQEAGLTDRWGKLSTHANGGPIRTADICPGCIAKLHGWENPYVGNSGVRVREWDTSRAAP